MGIGVYGRIRRCTERSWDNTKPMGKLMDRWMGEWMEEWVGGWGEEERKRKWVVHRGVWMRRQVTG